MRFAVFLRKNKIFAVFVIMLLLAGIYTGDVKRSSDVFASEKDVKRVEVSGRIVGVKIMMDGVMVLAAEEGNISGVFKAGDIIMSADGKNLSSKEDLINAVKNSGGKEMSFTFKRNGSERSCVASPHIDGEGNYKLGLWVRDSTQGLGTMTFYDKDTGKFGALGHGITDVDTDKLIDVSEGEICESKVTAVVKGKSGTPGELIGDLLYYKKLGDIEENKKTGIFGKASPEISGGESLEVGKKSQVKIGEAYILSGVLGDGVKPYSINVEGINRFAGDSSKSMIIKITDKRLTRTTGGIIQGMSGSPIIQNGRLIGAVTHVFLGNPEKGYGIFIENMM